MLTQIQARTSVGRTCRGLVIVDLLTELEKEQISQKGVHPWGKQHKWC